MSDSPDSTVADAAPPAGSDGQSSPSVRHIHDAGPANHRALVYEHRDEQLAAVVPFVRTGLESGDRVVYIADETPVDVLLASFDAAGIDVAAALESGALSIYTTGDLYGPVDAFDPDAVIDGLGELLGEVADSDAYDRLRITGEMTWALGGDADTLDAVVEYERALNTYFPDKPVLAMCQYNRARFSSTMLADILRAHPQHVYNATVTQNFAYVPSEEFYDTGIPVDAAAAFVETELDRVHARVALSEREAALSELADSASDFLEGDRAAIGRRAVETIDRSLSPSLTGVACYDEDSDALSLAATSADDADAVSLPEAYWDLMWNVFVTDECQQFSEFADGADCGPVGAPLRSGVIAPVDRHGVVFAASTAADAFSSADVRLVETVATSVVGALDRVEREETLERQNERLRRLSRVNTTIRRIDQALVGAASRREIDTAVCERLADTYQFVWVGERDPLSDAVTPRAWAGDGDLYLDSVYDATGADRTSPAHTALSTGSPCTVQNVLTCPEFDRWRTAALKQGYHATTSIPLVHEGTEYGVLSVYTAAPNRLSDMEREVLEELGSTIAYAIDATETKADRHAARSTQVSARIVDSRSRLRRLAEAVGTPLDVQTLLPESDGRLRVFFTAGDVAAEQVLSRARELASVERITHLADSDRGGLYQATISVERSLPTLMDRFDVSVAQLVATAEGLDVVIDVPSRTDVREFLDGFTEAYPETDVTAIQRSSRPIRTPASFFSSVADSLTERQLQVLRVAYHSGYFAWPRHSTAEEIAHSLDITQPTFAKHLRTSERKLLSLLFDSEPV